MGGSELDGWGCVGREDRNDLNTKDTKYTKVFLYDRRVISAGSTHRLCV